MIIIGIEDKTTTKAHLFAESGTVDAIHPNAIYHNVIHHNLRAERARGSVRVRKSVQERARARTR
jgi:hypothetical protein